MNKPAITRQIIINDLTHIPDDRIREVDNFVKFILSQIPQTKKRQEPQTLSGIWKNKGFEKITDLDNAIGETRNELENQILKRKI